MRIDIHHFIHFENDKLDKILENQQTIIMTQKEAAEKLDAFIAQSAENNAENQKNFDDLKAAIEEKGNVTPEIAEKLDTLGASLKAGDDITPDV